MGVNAVQIACDIVAYIGRRAADFRDPRPSGRRVRRAVHDRARRRHPRRHRAQHRAARLLVRVRDPPSAVRRPGGVLRRRAALRRDASSPRCTRSSRHAYIEFDHLSTLPGFDTHDDSDIAALGRSCNGTHETGKVSFGSEASLFHNANIPAVLCGPGHIEQAHQPNEWVTPRAARALRGVHAQARRPPLRADAFLASNGHARRARRRSTSLSRTCRAGPRATPACPTSWRYDRQAAGSASDRCRR